MAAFTFRLATLLKVRQRERDERRLELAKALDAQAVLAQAMESLMAELRQTDALQRAVAGPIDVERLLDAARYRFTLLLRRKDLQTKQAAVAQEVDRRRAALLEADRQVKSLEKLGELQAQRYHAEAARRETAALDEFALRFHAREVEP